MDIKDLKFLRKAVSGTKYQNCRVRTDGLMTTDLRTIAEVTCENDRGYCSSIHDLVSGIENPKTNDNFPFVPDLHIASSMSVDRKEFRRMLQDVTKVRFQKEFYFGINQEAKDFYFALVGEDKEVKYSSSAYYLDLRATSHFLLPMKLLQLLKKLQGESVEFGTDVNGYLFWRSGNRCIRTKIKIQNPKFDFGVPKLVDEKCRFEKVIFQYQKDIPVFVKKFAKRLIGRGASTLTYDKHFLSDGRRVWIMN